MKTLVIDIGGTFIKYGLIDENLNISHKDKKETDVSSLEGFLKEIKDIYLEFKDEVNGVAFSMPGFVNSETGFVKFGGALNNIISNVNIKDIFEELLETEVSVANDADCAALAEVKFGSLKEYDDAAVYIIGTAIGGSLIHEKKIIQGKGFASGEFSFMMTDFNNPSFENVLAFKCGHKALIQNVSKKLNKTINSGEEVFELIKEDNLIAINALKDYTKDIAVSLFNIQCIFDPSAIAIGGGISQQPILIDYIKNALSEIEKQNNNKLPLPNIVTCTFGNDANLIGAYSNFINK